MMSPTQKKNDLVVIGDGDGDNLMGTSPIHHFVLTPASGDEQSNINNNNNNSILDQKDISKSQCSSLSDIERSEWNEDKNLSTSTAINNSNNNNNINNNNNNSTNLLDPKSPIGINRNTWLRTSLRRSSPNNPETLPNRRWGSFRHSGRRTQNALGTNALASQLFRSSSFNSSGRSSNCDTTDEMYSDASLEEDVNDLQHKYQMLQQEVGILHDSAQQGDERYTRVKAENAALQARVIMLEEQLRDTEIRCEAKIQDEQRRSKELYQANEREKQLQLENASLQLDNVKSECEKLRKETQRQSTKIEKLEKQKEEYFNQLQDLNIELTANKEEMQQLKERDYRLSKDCEMRDQLLEDMSKEIERLKLESRTPALPTTSSESLRLEELHEEMSSLRKRTAHLEEANEELQANLLHAGLETGRLLTNEENSLAKELDIMSRDEVHKALKEQQEVNRQLRTYIEGILLNIVENHPQLLEVKQPKNGIKRQ